MEETIPAVKQYEGFGELIAGSSDPVKVLFTALAMVNHPWANQYLLDSRLYLQDRITKTVIFPRNGMALPNGETYSVPIVEVVPLTAMENSNES